MNITSFKDILPTLKDASHIQQLQLVDEHGKVVDRIDNVPGKSGSVSVYFHVSAEHGRLDKTAAEQALQLYAEHTEDARHNPGKHPNIDRLFDLIDNDLAYQVKVLNK
ncbi:MAG: DUF2322 family protein [Thioalkalispiraceae bacterium]|jgi:hypothetical protein